MARFDLSLPQSSFCDQINEIIVSILSGLCDPTIKSMALRVPTVN